MAMRLSHCELRFLHRKQPAHLCPNKRKNRESVTCCFPPQRLRARPQLLLPHWEGHSPELSMGWAPRRGRAGGGWWTGRGRQLICFLLYFLPGPDQESILGFFGI